MKAIIRPNSPNTNVFFNKEGQKFFSQPVLVDAGKPIPGLRCSSRFRQSRYINVLSTRPANHTGGSGDHIPEGGGDNGALDLKGYQEGSRLLGLPILILQ